MIVELKSCVRPIRRCQPLGIRRCRLRERLDLDGLRAMIDREAESAALHALHSTRGICHDAC